MNDQEVRGQEASISRRELVLGGVALAGAAAVGGVGAVTLTGARAQARGFEREIRVGLIGCGGRGTGAAANCLDASANTRLWAFADVFADRIQGCGNELAQFGDRAKVPAERCFTGFDAYKQLLQTEVDVVILATPPHFRPAHFAAAITSGKHVFMEKPVAVDPAGIRTVLDAGKQADEKKLCVVAGTQRRHEKSYLEAMRRVHAGALGPIVAGVCSWNQGGLWNKGRDPSWTDMEWQLRNWLYFTWLSGDHIVEQHVHNLDVMNWALQGHPVRAMGMGGRQVRVDPAYGHIFDHFAIEYEYPSGVLVQSYCRQIDGCASRVEETIIGTEGRLVTSPKSARLEGKSPWHFGEEDNEPYTQEHIDLIAAIEGGRHINEARNVAESTLTAIMGRISAYTGKAVTWEQALNSKLDLTPPVYELGSLPVPEVAVPGKTPLV